MSSFTGMYHRLKKHGRLVSPRGQKTLEIENALVTFEPYERFANFPSRKLSLNYIKDEVLWYLRGDLKDLSICDKAKIWKDCVTDGQLNSNYGHYIFRQKQLDYVIDCLRKDPDSRRAVIMILQPEHLYTENKDVPCTVSLSFRIRDKKLHCTTTMRSSDAIFGYGNDIPFFSLVQEFVLAGLNFLRAKDYELGSLTMFSESLHVYERHFGMLEKLLSEDLAPVACPRVTDALEVAYLRADHLDKLKNYPFSTWLNTRDPLKEKKA